MASEDAIFPHDKDAKKPYTHDYTDWLRDGDSLSSVAVSVVEGTATIASTVNGTAGSSAAASISGALATIWIVSASAGRLKLQFRVTTAQGEIDDKTHELAVGDY